MFSNSNQDKIGMVSCVPFFHTKFAVNVVAIAAADVQGSFAVFVQTPRPNQFMMGFAFHLAQQFGGSGDGVGLALVEGARGGDVWVAVNYCVAFGHDFPL